MSVLRDYANELGLALHDGQVRQFEIYVDMLLYYNQRFNLTAIEEKSDVVRKHFVDSLSLCKVLKQAETVIDIGSGAGFPGLPVAIAIPEVRVTLVDSLEKRVRFLKEVIAALGLADRVQAIHARAEELGKCGQHREGYDVAVSRAVARLNVLAELCLPLVRVGGLFVAMKGPAVDEELEEARGALYILGGGEIHSTRWELPGPEREGRVLLAIRKERSTPVKYPRRPGIPIKKPLS